MKRLAVASAILFFGCGTVYKPVPTTEKVTNKLERATGSTHDAQTRASEIEEGTNRTKARTSDTSQHVDTALAAITAKSYIVAAQELALAKASNAVVQNMLDQSLRDIQSLRRSLGETERALGEAQGDVTELNKKIQAVAEQGAEDHAIVEEVNWGFRLGALIYFVKGLLAKGFFGVLILGAVLIAMMIIGGPMGILALRILTALNPFKRK